MVVVRYFNVRMEKQKNINLNAVLNCSLDIYQEISLLF